MSIAQANYSKILLQFTYLNYNENSTLREQQLKQALDSICQKNAGIKEFNLQVADQLWQECSKNPDGTITLRQLISIITKAQGILKDNIKKAQDQLNAGVTEPERKVDLQESLAQYYDDLKLLSLPFQIPIQAELRISKQFNPDISRASQNQSGMDASGLFSGRSSGIFADVPSKREVSTSLKVTFIITIFLFIMELIICFHKNHFYNTLIYIAIFAIVLMGYFDKYYMKFILLNLALSIAFDLIWIIAQASPYWNPYPPTHHSTIQTPFLRFLFFFVIILMIAKALLIILFFRYRSNDDTVRKSVTVWGNVFEIDGRVKQNNPVSRLLSGRGVFGSTFQ